MEKLFGIKLDSLFKLPINSTQNLVQEYFVNISKFQYDKAKSCVEKSKDSSKIWTMFQTALIHFVNGEKFYNNLLFLNQKSISKIGQDKYYEPAIPMFEQVIREYTSNKSGLNSSSNLEANLQSNSIDTQNMFELSSQLLNFIDFRFQMMGLYFELKDKECRQEKGSVELSLKNLNEMNEKYASLFSHQLIEPLKNLFNIETKLLKNLLQCHFALDYKLDCIKSIVSIKEINDVFNNEPVLVNTKMSKENKSFSLFSRTNQQRSIPVLYQWFKIYYQTLLNKFSILMHDSFQKIDQIERIMNEKIEVYNKLFTYINKFSPSFTGIIFDTTIIGPSNFKGFGYEIVDTSIPMIPTDDKEHDIESYPFVFSYPKLKNEIIEKHIKNIISLIKSDFEQKVKYFYDQNGKSTYYLYKISDYYTFLMIFETNKQENRAKTTSFVQEIGDDLNLSNVFSIFNSNLK